MWLVVLMWWMHFPPQSRSLWFCGQNTRWVPVCPLRSSLPCGSDALASLQAQKRVREMSHFGACARGLIGSTHSAMTSFRQHQRHADSFCKGSFEIHASVNSSIPVKAVATAEVFIVLSCTVGCLSCHSGIGVRTIALPPL